MADRARFEMNEADETAREMPSGTGKAAELGDLIAHLLGAPMRYSLDAASMLVRMVPWNEVAWLQAELFRASFVWGKGLEVASAARPDHDRSTSWRGPGLPIRSVVEHRCPVVAKPDDTVQIAVARMTEEGCRSILVCDGGRLRGMFTERDLLTRVVGQGRDPKATRLLEVMTRDPERIESTATAHEALRHMDGFAHHDIAAVEEGRAIGVISLRDVPLGVLAEMLPELEQRRILAERMW